MIRACAVDMGRVWLRLFIGFALDSNAKAALAAVAATLIPTLPARYMSPALYRVTLAYLGERATAMLPAITALVDRHAANAAPFTLAAERVCYFGKPACAILYASLAPSPPLEAVGVSLRALLMQAGEAFDGKPLVPHITLAHKAVLAGVRPALPSDLPPCAISFTAAALTLFRSTRTEDVLVNLPIHTAPIRYILGG